ncbi:MAG TPA: hypothetical protein VMG12_09330, partial [Polyangiaceae bacterium]|nr:hypothetical protein [Polyangiaceae bacterium]
MNQFDERARQPSGAGGFSLARGVVVGWFDSGSTAERPCVDHANDTRGPIIARTTSALSDAAVPRAVAARHRGESVVLEGEREVILKCGDASLTLRRDGKAIIRGAYVETH